MAETPHRVLLIDDHPIVLKGIAGFLADAGYRLATARNLAEARHWLLAERCDLILLDINLADENGLDLLEYRGDLLLPERVLLISGITEQELIFKGFELGAFAFIPKSIEPQELLEAIADSLGKSALPNSGWFWASDKRLLVDAHEHFPRETTLTPKERAVFMLLRTGKLDKQIADELGLSIHTVRVHLRAIKRKRGHNRRFEQSL